MQGNPDVIKTLQFALPQEAHLNLTYRKCWRNLKWRGLNKLAKVFHQFGTDAHHWMRKVDDRILFLGGDDTYDIDPIQDYKSIAEMFTASLALEMAIVKPYEESVQVCMKALDDTSRNLFEHLLKWHQQGKKGQPGHIAWLEANIELMKAVGESQYLAEKI